MKPDLLKTNQTLRRGIYNSAIIHKFFAWPIGAILLAGIFMAFGSCNKQIQEPEHKNDGSNVLYFNIDGKGYLIRDRCFDLPSRKTGDIYGGDDKGSLPRYGEVKNLGDGVMSLQMSFCFDKTSKDALPEGELLIEFKNTNGQIRVSNFAFTGKFFSPKINKIVAFWTKNYPDAINLKIDNFSKITDYVSGQLSFKYYENDPNQLVQVYIYFDVEVNNTQ